MVPNSEDVKDQISVVVVEDSKSVRSLIVHLLKLRGLFVKGFEFPQQAFEFINKTPPLILITDFNMPVINGLELVGMCKDKDIKLRTILVTSFGDKETLLNAIHAQIDAFVEKPFNTTNFYLALDKVIELIQIELDNEALIEELSLKNHELNQQTLKLTSIFSGINEAILLLSESGKIEYLNEICFTYFNRHSDDLINLNISQLLPIENVIKVFTDEQGEFEVNYTHQLGNSLVLNCKYSKFKILNESKYVVCLSDISSLRHRQAFLEEKSDILEAEVLQRTKDLTFAKDEAERANATKSEFLANMSHELRTPMHAMISFSHLILKKCNLISDSQIQKKIHEFASSIELSGERLLALLNNLLDMAKLESGQSNFNPQEQGITKLLKQGVDELNMLAADKNITINLKNDTNVDAWFDYTLILQVLINLLSNAIKFSPIGSFIDVGTYISFEKIGKRDLDRKIEVLNIFVVDLGVGIPDTELEMIFDKFSQSTTTKTGAGGTGLGLSICKEILLLHRGDICAKNNLDVGAIFTFFIPTHKPDWCER